MLDRAHAIVAAFAATDGPAAWRLERSVVAGRLHQLVDDPDLIRQGNLNLCGPAAVFVVWLRVDPVAAMTFAVRLFRDGHAPLGVREVRACPSLLDRRYGTNRRASSCPQADWMLMAALRDSTNRTLRYSRPDGPTEAAAAITLPGAMRGWLTATGRFPLVVDQTSLVRRKPFAHALELAPAPDLQVLLLVAQEMFARPESRYRRARDRVRSLVPNHWIILRSSVEAHGADRVGFRFWSWGGEHRALLDRARFTRCYHGSVSATLGPPVLPDPA
jgi:hypothetical protein